MAVAKPNLTAPREAAQGTTATLTVGVRGAHGCRISARGPAGRLQHARIPGSRSYSLRLSIARKAATGNWILRVRCRVGSSGQKRVNVSGNAFAAGPRLFLRAKAQRFTGPRPRGYTDPRRAQNSADGPALGLPLPPVGIGGGDDDGGRAQRALDWAYGKLGSTEYLGLGLRFVAFAYAARAFPRSATILANALGPLDGDQPPRRAPRGALMWFSLGDPNIGRNDGHVGISLGDGRMIHALGAVEVSDVGRSRWWRSRYRGWSAAPDAWLGRPPPTPPDGEVAPPLPPPPVRKILTVDNRVTNGMAMTQDGVPLRLTTEKRTFCTRNGCNVNGTERTSGQMYDAAVCQSTGERFTNGNDRDSADDANPERYESTLYYGVKLADGTFGYVNEVWIRAADRGGLSLPVC